MGLGICSVPRPYVPVTLDVLLRTRHKRTYISDKRGRGYRSQGELLLVQPRCRGSNFGGDDVQNLTFRDLARGRRRGDPRWYKIARYHHRLSSSLFVLSLARALAWPSHARARRTSQVARRVTFFFLLYSGTYKVVCETHNAGRPSLCNVGGTAQISGIHVLHEYVSLAQLSKWCSTLPARAACTFHWPHISPRRAAP